MTVKNIWFENPNDFIDNLAKIWLTNQASDIHITPWLDNVTVKFRIWWELRPIYTFSNELYSKFINAMKVKSGMDISEHNHIQDWKMFFKVDMNWKNVWVNLRVSSLPVLHWENIVMRLLLAESKYLELDSLWYSPGNISLLKDISNLNEWLVLVCWWTWSWKTTTLYSLLNTFDKSKKWIFTLEDPVEYQVEWYIQSQIRSLKGSWDASKSYTFEEGLIWILRQDPDIIMIWELRREEEAKTCFEAANTWHIVLWTIHSNNAVSVITRVRQFWIESYLIASWLKYIISQKISKHLCPHCKEEVNISKWDFSEKIQKFINTDSVKVYKNHAAWCSECTNWYNWIILVWEVIEIDDKLYNLLLKNTGETEIKEALLTSWFVPYYIDWFKKSLEWKMSIDDVLDLEY
jgi:type II secretory ATPase GspE/PulE/Tfp pilus assembly ATPase PilB-like protein